jgi:hypothetical protein
MEAFGRYLVQERELRGLTREAVIKATKLAPGDAARMPAKAYLVGYLRTYAAAVGLDADDVVLRWQEASGDMGERPAVVARRPVMVIAVAAAVALVVAAMAAIALVKRDEPPPKTHHVERGAYVPPTPDSPPPSPPERP